MKKLKTDTFDRTVLLSIYRTYSKDEAVAELIKLDKQHRIEIGKLQSHIAELEDTQPRKKIKDWTKDEAFAAITKELKDLKAACKKHKKNEEEWMNKYFALISKQQRPS